MKLVTIKKRQQFLSLSATGNKVVTKGVVVEFSPSEVIFSKPASKNPSLSASAIIPQNVVFGFTASKKVGSSVSRNLAKRRLRAATRMIYTQHPKLFKQQYSYNLIARHTTTSRPFTDLVRDLKYALHNVK